MSELSGLRVAVLATDGFEEPELTEPVPPAELLRFDRREPAGGMSGTVRPRV